MYNNSKNILKIVPNLKSVNRSSMNISYLYDYDLSDYNKITKSKLTETVVAHVFPVFRYSPLCPKRKQYSKLTCNCRRTENTRFAVPETVTCALTIGTRLPVGKSYRQKFSVTISELKKKENHTSSSVQTRGNPSRNNEAISKTSAEHNITPRDPDKRRPADRNTADR